HQAGAGPGCRSRPSAGGWWRRAASGLLPVPANFGQEGSHLPWGPDGDAHEPRAHVARAISQQDSFPRQLLEQRRPGGTEVGEKEVSRAREGRDPELTEGGRKVTRRRRTVRT